MKITIIIILIFCVSYMGGYWLKNKDTINSPSDIYFSHCDITKAPCKIEDAGLEYLILFDGPPSPLKPFTVKLITPQIQPDSVEIEFLMQGMDMGFNHYTLKLENSKWQARVILPVCSLGSNEWLITIKVKGNGLVHHAQLSFLQ